MTGAPTWWAWLLFAACLTVLSIFAVAFAVLPAETRPGGRGCLVFTGLLIVLTLLSGGMGVVLFVRWAWSA